MKWTENDLRALNEAFSKTNNSQSVAKFVEENGDNYHPPSGCRSRWDRGRQNGEEWVTHDGPPGEEGPEVPDPLEPDHPELRDLERKLRLSKDEVSQLKRKLQEADADVSLYGKLVGYIEDIVQPIPFKKATRKPPQGSHNVDAVAVLSDEHADEVIHSASTWGLESYDFNVFRCRLQRWAEVIVGYALDHLPQHTIERLWVFSLGDKQHGDIHDHKHRNHFSNSLEASLAIGDAEAEALAWINSEAGLPIHVVCVSGNHPRQTIRKDFDAPHDNLDFLTAAHIATRLSNYPDVTVVAPAAYSAYVDVRGKLCALNHGDDVVGYAGFPWYGFSRKNNRVQSLLRRHLDSVDYFFYGHFHTPVEWTDGAHRSIHSGAFTVTDPYAINKVSAASEPLQYLCLFDDKPGQRGLILPIPIFLRDEDREQALRDGTFEPSFGRRLVIDSLRGDSIVVGEFPVVRAT